MKTIRNTIIILAFLLPLLSLGQKAKKPTLMVVPSDAYCIKNNFVSQGSMDYKKAFQNDRYLRLVVTMINSHMAKEGFPQKDMEAVIKSNEIDDFETSLETGKDKAQILETPKDVFKRRAKADIILDLDFNLIKNGPNTNLVVNLKGNDAYTDKQISSAILNGETSMNLSNESLLIENMYALMTNFCSDLQSHFDDMFANGREVNLRFRLTQNAQVDFEKEYNGKELNEIIDDWLKELCVQSVFNIGDITENLIKIEQARIPLFNENNKAMDAREFMQIIRKRLAKDPFRLSSRVAIKGLGFAEVIVGGNSQ